MIAYDNEDDIVLESSLVIGGEPDSIYDVTSAGTSGLWTVTVTLTFFNSDKSLVSH